MQEISLDWANFKSDIADKGFFINYISNHDHYDVFAIDRTIIWKTTVVSGADVTDFENNYKAGANYNISSPRYQYKSQTLTTTDEWQELDLVVVYFDSDISNCGANDAIIKLNNTSNDEIDLCGGETKDVCELENFSLSKIYYKSKIAESHTTLSVVAIK